MVEHSVKEICELITAFESGKVLWLLWKHGYWVMLLLEQFHCTKVEPSTTPW